MKILHISIVETCTEAQNAYDVYFNDLINEDFIENFRPLGKVVYTDIYYKKYFRVIVKGKYTIKGFIDTDNFRVLFGNSNSEGYIEELKQFIGLI